MNMQNLLATKVHAKKNKTPYLMYIFCYNKVGKN